MLIRRHPTDIIQLIPKRAKDAHKGSCGRLLLIAGSNKYSGAAKLMVEAALRSGIGMVYVIAIHQVANLIRSHSPEAIVMEVPEENGIISEKAMSVIQTILNDVDINAVGIGPGIGSSEKLESFYSRLVGKLIDYNIPTLVDADALSPIFKQIGNKEIQNINQFIFTPHPKEFAHMINQSFESIANKADVLKEAKRIKQVIVYKTSKTVVANEKELWLSMTGNEGLATAGSGDVLAGIISGFLGQGVSGFNAAKLGVYMHGLTAEIAVNELGIHSVLARDLCKFLPDSFQEVLHGSR